MKYCVIKNSTTVIESSEQPIEIMLVNALNSGFTESEVEILTEEEYEARKALEPHPPQVPTAEERITELENMILIMMEVM